METDQRRVAVITGGARGIGLGIARCFAQRGDAVVLADLDGEQAAEAATACGDAFNVDAHGLSCDVSDRDSVESLVAAVVERFGRVDVLVNNAGVCPFVDCLEIAPELWRKTLDVNVTGAFHCTQIIGRRFIEQGQGGRVISVTSLSTNVTGAQQADYAASKAALRMMTKSFAVALGPHGVTCNCIAPGMILTDMTRHHWEQPGPAAEIKQRVPVGRIGQPEDIGRAAVFLASAEAEYINGTTIRVDGGHQAVCN